jgi:hypothetical protein
MSAAQVQGELWGRQPAAWAELFEPRLRPLYEAALDALEPLAGAGLLDAGCGAGLSLRLAADRGAVRAALAKVLEADRKPDGSLRQDNVFRYVLATK